MSGRWPVALAAFALAAGGASGSAAAAPPPAPSGFWGVVPVTAPSPNLLARIRRAGVRSIRAPLNWSQVERRQGQLDWSSFDSLVATSARRGIGVLPFLVSTPEWVAPTGAVLPVDTSFQRAAWSEFVRAAVGRYGRGGAFWAEHRELRPRPIETWQIWNEPNLAEFAQPPDPARYGILVRLSTWAIHDVDATARILLAGMFVSPLVALANAYPAGAFLSRLYAEGAARASTGVAVHPYVPSYPFLASIMESIRLLMRRYHAAAAPLWITEMGWSSLPPGRPFAKGRRGQARQLHGAFSLFARKRRRWRLARIYWFSLTDSVNPDACSFCLGTGLFSAALRPKPAWRSFARFSRAAGRPSRHSRARRRRRDSLSP